MIILDTHALVWWANGDLALLTAPARQAIETELQAGQIGVSAISAWEIALLVQRGRLELAMDVSRWIATVQQIEAVQFIPVDTEIAIKSVELPGDFHKDPADRMIVATARKLGVALVSADEKIQSYPHVRTIW